MSTVTFPECQPPYLPLLTGTGLAHMGTWGHGAILEGLCYRRGGKGFDFSSKVSHCLPVTGGPFWPGAGSAVRCPLIEAVSPSGPLASPETPATGHL